MSQRILPRLSGALYKELKLAAEELRKRWQNHSSHFPVTARKLAELLAAAETQEAVLAQRRVDIELRRAQADSAPCAIVPPAGKTVTPGEILARDDQHSGQLYGEF